MGKYRPGYASRNTKIFNCLIIFIIIIIIIINLFIFCVNDPFLSSDVLICKFFTYGVKNLGEENL